MTTILRQKLAVRFVAAVPNATARGLLALLVTGLLWGMVVIGPAFVPDASATSIVGGRFVVLGVVSFTLGRRHLRGADWSRAFQYAFAGFVGYYLLLVFAIQRAGPAPAAAVIGLTPVLYALAGAHRERLAVRRLAGPMAVLLIGLALAQVVEMRSAGERGASDLLMGLGLAVASVLVWIWYGLQNGRYLRSHQVNGTRWTSVVGVAAGILGLPFLLHGLTLGGGIGTAPQNWFAVVIILGFGSAWLGTVAWNAASALLPEAVLGPLLGIELLIGLAYAHLFTRSWPAPITAAGYGLLLAGVVYSVIRVDRLRAAAVA